MFGVLVLAVMGTVGLFVVVASAIVGVITTSTKVDDVCRSAFAAGVTSVLAAIPVGFLIALVGS